MKTEKTSITIYPDMKAQIESRGARSTIISRDLERLYTLYRRALDGLDFTIDEASAITDTLCSSLMDATSSRLLWASVEDAIELEGLSEKWDITSDLVEKLKSLSDIQAMAVVDAAERFWNNSSLHDDFRAGVARCFRPKE